ncbi:MAG TPA: VWA domain-containing protein, partial [Terriglobales bacterium]|nr:VWA domain-containing protein [Terriglobales bacterium]
VARRINTMFALLVISAAIAPTQIASALQSEVSGPANSDNPPHFQFSVNEVNQVFTVLNRKGHPISDLQRNDFVIKDAGLNVNNVLAFRQQTETPLNIAVAIDLSGSVSSRVDYEVQVTTKFLTRVLRAGDSGRIIGFNYLSYPIDDLAQAGKILREIHRREPGAGTAFYDAVIFACDRLATAPETNRREVLVIISDGEDNGSRSTFQDALHAALRRGVIVLVLYTGFQGPTRELHTLADMTGGDFFNGYTVRGMVNALAKAERAIRGQYLLAYRPPGFTPDGRFRQISIRTVAKGLQVRCRKGYYAEDTSAATPRSK